MPSEMEVQQRKEMKRNKQAKQRQQRKQKMQGRKVDRRYTDLAAGNLIWNSVSIIQ